MTSRSVRCLLAAAAASSLFVAQAGAQGLFGPGKFRIEQVDDRFSAAPVTTVVGLNNRLTKKSPVGGIYVNAQGFYLNPILVKSRTGGKVLEVGFTVENRTEIDTTYGSPNTLGALERVTFLVDGTRLIVGNVSAGRQQFSNAISYNTISRSASSGLSESGTIEIQPADMATLAAAKTLAVQVEGSSRSWTIEAKDVSKSFLANLATFYREQIAH